MDLTALRLVTAEDQEADLAKSLSSLIKYNNGYWKSEKQGMFLLKLAVSLQRVGRSSSDYRDARTWADRQRADRDTTVVFPYKRLLEQYGRSESKARYVGWFFLVDESGVVSCAKVKIDHRPKTTQQEIPGTVPIYQFDFMPDTATFTFQRPASVPPITVPFFAQTKAEEAERERRKKENEGLITTLKNVAGYHENSFLQDMVYQLEQGRVLSPKQIQVVNKFLPKISRQPIEAGTPAEWAAALEAIYSLVESKVLPGFIAALDESDRTQAEDNKRYEEETGFRALGVNPHNAQVVVPEAWKRFREGEPRTSEGGLFWYLDKIFYALDDVLRANIKNVHAQGRFQQLRDLALAAIKAKGRGMSKVRLDAVLTIKKLADKLSTMSPAAFDAYWRKS
jgi:hypothetical protein